MSNVFFRSSWLPLERVEALLSKTGRLSNYLKVTEGFIYMLRLNATCFFVSTMHIQKCFTSFISTALNIDAGLPDDPRELLQRFSREMLLITVSNSYTYAQEGNKKYLSLLCNLLHVTVTHTPPCHYSNLCYCLWQILAWFVSGRVTLLSMTSSLMFTAPTEGYKTVWMRFNMVTSFRNITAKGQFLRLHLCCTLRPTVLCSFCHLYIATFYRCKQKTIVDRRNRILQLPNTLIINHTGGRHIRIEEVVVFGEVSTHTIIHSCCIVFSFITLHNSYWILLLNICIEYSYWILRLNTLLVLNTPVEYSPPIEHSYWILL